MFPSTQSKPETWDEALSRIKSLAGRVKFISQALKTRSAAGSVSTTSIIEYVQDLQANKVELTRLASTSGLQSYAATQYPALDITAEYLAMVAQVEDTITWVFLNFPKAATGELLERKMDENGVITVNTFSSAQLANFRTQLDLLIATID